MSSLRLVYQEDQILHCVTLCTMEDSVELVVESVTVNPDLASLPRVGEHEWGSMVGILEKLDVSQFKYKKPVPWQGRKFPARITKVCDADTINIVFCNERQEPEMVSVRLHLVDAPETKLRKGVSKLQKATGLSVAKYVQDLLHVGDVVSVAVREHCIYNNRVIGAIFFGEGCVDLSAHLLEKKLVKPYSGEQKREPWKDEELLDILRRIPDHQTEEAKSFILHGVNSRGVSLGATPPASASSSSASLVVPVLNDSKAEGKKRQVKPKKKEGTSVSKVSSKPIQSSNVSRTSPNQVQSPPPMAIPFGMPSGQGGATMIIPQSWFQPPSGDQQQQQPSPYQSGIPVFMPYPYMSPPPQVQSRGRGRGRGGRGRAQRSGE